MVKNPSEPTLMPKIGFTFFTGHGHDVQNCSVSAQDDDQIRVVARSAQSSTLAFCFAILAVSFSIRSLSNDRSLNSLTTSRASLCDARASPCVRSNRLFSCAYKKFLIAIGAGNAWMRNAYRPHARLSSDKLHDFVRCAFSCSEDRARFRRGHVAPLQLKLRFD